MRESGRWQIFWWRLTQRRTTIGLWAMADVAVQPTQRQQGPNRRDAVCCGEGSERQKAYLRHAGQCLADAKTQAGHQSKGVAC